MAENIENLRATKQALKHIAALTSSITKDLETIIKSHEIIGKKSTEIINKTSSI